MKKNIIISALGIIVPGLLFLLITPQIIKEFGIERFGYITLIWIILGITNVLDLGMSKAITRYIAESYQPSLKKIKDGNLWIMLLIGLAWGVFLGGIFLYVFNTYSTSVSIKNPNISQELAGAAYIVSFTMPLVIAYSILKGMSEGVSDFITPSTTKIIMGIVIVALLLSSEYFEANLVFVSQVFLISRLAGLILILIKILGLFSITISQLTKSTIKGFFVFGGWLSISTIASAFLVYADRFIFSYYLTTIEFGTYSTLSETLSRLLVIGGAISTVLFPMLAKGSKKNSQIIKKSYLYSLFLAVIILIPVNIFGEQVFSYWLNIDYASIDINIILLVLSVGITVNIAAHIPYAIIHANGDSKFTAKLHIVELVLFIPTLIIMTAEYGLLGGVLIWLIRVSVDFFFLRNYSLLYIK